MLDAPGLQAFEGFSVPIVSSDWFLINFRLRKCAVLRFVWADASLYTDELTTAAVVIDHACTPTLVCTTWKVGNHLATGGLYPAFVFFVCFCS